MGYFFKSTFEGFHHLYWQISNKSNSIQEHDFDSRWQDNSKQDNKYKREVVVSVWNSKSLLLTYSFFIIQFINADFPTFVYPTSAITGILLFLLFALSCVIFLNLVSSQISFLIFAYLSRICLLYIYNCDSPSPLIVLTALRCFADITYIVTYWACIKSPKKMFRFEEQVAPSLTSRVFK